MAIFTTMVPMLLWLMTLYPLSLVHATIMMNLWDIGPPLPHSPLAAVVPILTGWQAIAAMRPAPLVMYLSIFTVLNAAYWRMAHKKPFLTMNSKHYSKRYRA